MRDAKNDLPCGDAEQQEVGSGKRPYAVPNIIEESVFERTALESCIKGEECEPAPPAS